LNALLRSMAPYLTGFNLLCRRIPTWERLDLRLDRYGEQRCCVVAMYGLDQMSTSIRCQLDSRVHHEFAHVLNVNPLRQGDAGMSVTRVVEAAAADRLCEP